MNKIIRVALVATALVLVAIIAATRTAGLDALEGYTTSDDPGQPAESRTQPDANTDGGREDAALPDDNPQVVNEVDDSTVLAVASPYNVLQFGYDVQHTSNDAQETSLTTANVSTLHRAFRITLPDVADGRPEYLSAVNTPGGVQDLVFVTTKSGALIALNAHTGAQVWMHQYGPGSCIFGITPVPCYMQSQPAIDPNLQYIYAYGLDGNIHKYRVGDGTEITGGGWPEPTTAKPFEKVSTDLAIATSKSGATYLYVGHSGKTDYGDYQGHLTTINLADGTQHVFNMVCSNMVDIFFVLKPGTPDCPVTKSGVWTRTPVVYNSATDRIYVAVGNGRFSPSLFYWGFVVMALNPNGTGASGGIPLDTFTPTNWQNMSTLDQDFSSSPAILPAPSNSLYQHLVVQTGKDSVLRLLNLDNLSGQGGPGHTGGELQVMNSPQGNEFFSTPAVWVNPADGSTWVYFANLNGLAALQLTVDGTGHPSLQSRWTIAHGSTSPVVANGILYVASQHLVQALNPVTGALLWSTTSLSTVHWESPLIANGMLYITDQGKFLTGWIHK